MKTLIEESKKHGNFYFVTFFAIVKLEWLTSPSWEFCHGSKMDFKDVEHYAGNERGMAPDTEGRLAWGNLSNNSPSLLPNKTWLWS